MSNLAENTINSTYLVPVCIALIVIAAHELIRVKNQSFSVIQRGRVDTSLIHPADYLGFFLIASIFGALILLNQAPPEVGADGEPRDVKITPFVLLFGMIGQAVPAVIVLVFILARDANPVKFFELLPKWKYARLLFVVVPIALIQAYIFMVILKIVGYEEWLKSTFGEDAQNQEIVRIFQEADAVIIRVLLGFMAIIVAPLAEEIVFRGYFYPIIKRCGGATLAIILTSLMFAAVHTNVPALLPLFFLAVLFALAYEITGTLWAPILIHAAFNATTIVFQEIARNQPPV
ncbi:MAG: lysostaphin resistance A-like protein [Akkermansiaceae bacterium]